VYRIGAQSKGPMGFSRHENPINRRKTGYNLSMSLAIVAMRILEVMFFVGLIGSAVVVLISFVEDGKELFGKDEPPESRA
jgi:hypothetical protein